MLVVFSTKVNLLFLLFNGQEVLSSASDKAKLFAKHFSKNSNLEDPGMPSPDFYFRINLKLHNISVTHKMVRKVIMNLDSPKGSGSDCIPLVVLKNSEPKISYILAEYSNMYLKEFVSKIVGRSHRWSLFFRMLGKGLQLKTTALLVLFLWLIKSLKNLLIKGLLIT